jgi:tetrapyrrole methylase family protein/MazG family protein
VIEEAYEVLDVLDQIQTDADLKKDSVRAAFREELGDLLMQVVLHSEMTREAGAFGIDDVVAGLNDKLIRRHPHVFGESKADSVETAFQTWEKQKAKEKSANPDASVLDGVPKGLPGLQKAARVLEKVTKVGFQWEDMQGPLAKVEEELAEMKEEVLALEKLVQSEKAAAAARANPSPSPAAATPSALTSADATAAQRKKLESEMGDLFFTLCNVAFLMKVSPEDALRSTLARFESRFRHVERSLKKTGKLPEQSTLEEMDRYWNEAKQLERQASGSAEKK